MNVPTWITHPSTFKTHWGKGCGWILILTSLAACAPAERVIEPDARYAPIMVNDPPEVVRSQNGAIYQPATSIELFRNNKAYRTGDILTIILEEQTDAVTRSATSTAKDNTWKMGSPTLLGTPVTHNGNAILGASLDASRNFSGSGNSSQSNSLEGNITVMVSKVLSNGNLVVRGEKIVSINQGAESLRLSGIVRPEDIRPDNSVFSSRIANARVHYGGAGTLADSNQKGWLSRILSGKYWPF